MYVLTEDFVRRIYRRRGHVWASKGNYAANVTVEGDTGKFGHVNIHIETYSKELVSRETLKWKILLKDKVAIEKAALDAVQNYNQHISNMHKKDIL